MNYFYIDTSSSYLYAGIVSNNKLVASIKCNYNKDLSKYTVSEIEKLFKKAEITPNCIDKIIVVSGPGSFTGIRVGMTFAKIFAWALTKEITTITSLDAMASSINYDKFVIPIIDARRGYVYAGIYKKDEVILKNQYIKLDDLKEYLTSLNDEYVFITNDKKMELNNILKYDPDILKIIEKYKNKKSINPHLVEPDYLKLTEAEENLGSNLYDNRVKE